MSIPPSLRPVSYQISKKTPCTAHSIAGQRYSSMPGGYGHSIDGTNEDVHQEIRGCLRSLLLMVHPDALSGVDEEKTAENGEAPVNDSNKP